MTIIAVYAAQLDYRNCEADVKRIEAILASHHLFVARKKEIFSLINKYVNEMEVHDPHQVMELVADALTPAAEALAAAHRSLAEHGYGLLVFDAYRPWFVTKMFWDATPGNLKDFVADPASGSRHNRGCAVDLTLFDLDTGERSPWRTIQPEDATGMLGMTPMYRLDRSDLDAYAGERGRRGNKLPRGFQNVDRIELS